MTEIKLPTYKELERKYVKDVDSECIILEHIKTKAKVLLISNEDENKVFSIAFRTPPTDSTGLPHILEHSVLCGSRKFPVKDPFVELMKSSLNTFLNAFTSPDKTMYPVASCNDKDFANLMDVYLDATLYPNIYKYEEIFRQEGWHYELADKDSDIIINGVVYNEMKGAYSNPEQVLFRESLAALLPDTCYGVSSGGNPDNIPELSYEDFINFHKKYYHPSNSYIVLYGNMDMEERLNWMDENYLSNFDELKIDSAIKNQEPFKETRYVRLPYPIGQDEDENNKAMFSYNVTSGNVEDPLLWMSNTILSYVLLDAPGAVLKDALVNKKVGLAVSGGYQDGLNQPMFTVISKGCNEEQRELFVNTIEETLKDIVDKGIDKKSLMATINYYEFMYRESDFGRMPKGLVYAMNAFNTWLYDYDPLLTLEVGELFDKLKELVETDYFEKLIEKYYINNSHKAVVTIYPNKNVQKEKDDALKLKLKEMKDAMSEDEISALVQKTKDLKTYSMTPSTKEELRSLPLLTRDDIKKDVLKYSNNLKEVNGLKVIQHDYFTNKIGYLKLLFDITKIEEKYLPYLGLLGLCLSRISTKHYDYRELDNEINIKTGGIDFGALTFSTDEVGGYSLVMSVMMRVLFDKVKDGVDLIHEIITTSNFKDHKRLKEIVLEANANIKNRFVSSGHMVSQLRAMSYLKEDSKVNDCIRGIEYSKFISNLADNFDDLADEVTSNLEELVRNVFRSDNLLISYTANDEGFKLLDKSLESLSSLPKKTTIKFNYEFKKENLNEGFKTSSNVQYVARCGNFKEKGYDYTGAINVFKKALSTEYLWMKVRVDGGAYGCMCGFSENGDSYFVSYRDPNLERTYNIYGDILKFIDGFNPTEEELTKYIIGAFGEIDAPLTPQQLGSRSLSAYLMNKTEEDALKIRKEMIECKVSDIKALRPIMEAVLSDNNICVIGNENKIEEASHMFKNISYLGK